MSKYNYDLVLQDIRTLDDLRLMSGQIDQLLVSLFKATSDDFNDTLQTKLQRTLGTHLMLSLKSQNIRLDNQEQLQLYFTGLREYISHLPVLQLTLAYHPTNEQVEQLSEWVRAETVKPVILQLIYNKIVLGGAIITYQGRIIDLSLKKKFERVYETKREEILGLLK